MRKEPVWLRFSEPALLVELFSILWIAENISFSVSETLTLSYIPRQGPNLGYAFHR